MAFRHTIRVIGYFFLTTCASDVYGSRADYTELRKNYLDFSYKFTSDICEHIPTLHDLSTQCTSVVEIGIRDMNSTWGILSGLSDNGSREKIYLGIDLVSPPEETLSKVRRLAQGCGITFLLCLQNDMTIKMEPVDMIFIDSLHTYCHLTYELETFSPKVAKFIAMHDTSEPWGDAEDDTYHGDYSEYPAWIDRTKKGLWPAVEDFLTRHPEWKLKSRVFNRHGFTVLERIGERGL